MQFDTPKEGYDEWLSQSFTVHSLKEIRKRKEQSLRELRSSAEQSTDPNVCRPAAELRCWEAMERVFEGRGQK